MAPKVAIIAENALCQRRKSIEINKKDSSAPLLKNNRIFIELVNLKMQFLKSLFFILWKPL
jgi:hypothetical protein